MINTLIDMFIVFLDKYKFKNPKVYAVMITVFGLGFIAQIVLPLFGVEIQNDTLIQVINSVAGIFLGIANPTTNRYLINKGLKSESEYTVEIKNKIK